MKKKLLAALLIMATAVSLNACGSKGGSSSSGSDEKSSGMADEMVDTWKDSGEEQSRYFGLYGDTEVGYTDELVDEVVGRWYGINDGHTSLAYYDFYPDGTGWTTGNYNDDAEEGTYFEYIFITDKDSEFYGQMQIVYGEYESDSHGSADSATKYFYGTDHYGDSDWEAYFDYNGPTDDDAYMFMGLGYGPSHAFVLIKDGSFDVDTYTSAAAFDETGFADEKIERINNTPDYSEYYYGTADLDKAKEFLCED